VIEQTVDGETTTFVVDGLLSVIDAAPARFEAQVIVLQFAFGGPVIEGAPPSLDRDGFVELFADWRVGWMGVEG
jgi:hypothetical protein